MRRREVIALLALSAGAGPLASLAQTGIKRVGVVYQGGPYEVTIEGLREGLRARGLEEGRNVALVLHHALGNVAEAEAAAGALERDEKVDVIVAVGTTTARPRLARSSGPPPRSQLCAPAGTDPVSAGLVESIAKPGARLTGFHFLTNDLTAKRLEILREIVPKLRRLVTFYDPRTPGAVTSLAAAREAAGKLDLEVVAQQVSSSEELRDRLRSLSTVHADAYFFVADFLVIGHAPLVIAAANTLRLPTMATDVSVVRAGALAAYGPDFREYGPRRRPARYVARILGGSLPGDLPVEVINQPALAINLKTAKAIDLDIPPLLLTRADEVIE